MTGQTRPEFGAIVISLDFELHWGVRDHSSANGPYRTNLMGARAAVPLILDRFAQHAVSATWATVGALFAGSSAELRDYLPVPRPKYRDARLDPYAEPLGDTEADDPIHFARSLVQLIASTADQEVGSHTFSHFYALEPGQTRADFAADLRSAKQIAAAYGLPLRSFVFPRHQANPEYLPILRDEGFHCYRGRQKAWFDNGTAATESSRWRRALRLLDRYIDLTGSGLISWDQLADAALPVNLPASRFLAPYSPPLRFAEDLRRRRITAAMSRAARSASLFHLWWHPHNFGRNTAENLATLDVILDHFEMLRARYGMRSLTMSQACALARSATRQDRV